MKKLEDFMANIDEARTKLEPHTIDGAKSKGLAELDPKTDDSVMDKTGMEEEDMSENEERVQERFDFEKPFFILGHAGWAKTSIVKRLAKRNGYHILIVYLDKAVKEDLGGMPIIVDDPEYPGEKTTKIVPPEWAREIIRHPEEKFLLFFDEMNQADPEVMNALMPIVQDNYIPGANTHADKKDEMKRNRCDNFLVGAAGNYKSENKATHELSGPLLSRFKPLIIWEDNSDAAWEDTFKFFHKDWDAKVGKDFVDAFWPYHSIFDNPRELEQKLWEPYYNVKKKGLQGSKRFTPDKIARYLYGGKDADGADRLIKKEVADENAKRYCNEMAEIIYEWLHEGEKKATDSAEEGEEGEEGESRRSGSAKYSMDENVRLMIDSAVKKGYLDGDTFNKPGVLYAVGPDIIYKIFSPEEVNAEAIKHYLKHLESKGITWKYKSTADAVKNIKAGNAKVMNPMDDKSLGDEWGE